MTNNKGLGARPQADQALVSDQDRLRGLDPTGFDPSRMVALQIRCETFEDCLRTVCYHLELPQSESGPCDDPSMYDRELEALDLAYRNAEAARALAVSRQFRAEAALEPFARVGGQIGAMWDNKRRAETLSIKGLLVSDFRRAKQVVEIARDSDGSPEGRDAAERLDGNAATARAGTASPSPLSQSGQDHDR